MIFPCMGCQGTKFVQPCFFFHSGKVVRLALKDLKGVFIDCYADRKAKL